MQILSVYVMNEWRLFWEWEIKQVDKCSDVLTVSVYLFMLHRGVCLPSHYYKLSFFWFLYLKWMLPFVWLSSVAEILLPEGPVFPQNILKVFSFKAKICYNSTSLLLLSVYHTYTFIQFGRLISWKLSQTFLNICCVFFFLTFQIGHCNAELSHFST